MEDSAIDWTVVANNDWCIATSSEAYKKLENDFFGGIDFGNSLSLQRSNNLEFIKSFVKDRLVFRLFYSLVHSTSYYKKSQSRFCEGWTTQDVLVSVRIIVQTLIEYACQQPKQDLTGSPFYSGFFEKIFSSLQKQRKKKPFSMQFTKEDYLVVDNKLIDEDSNLFKDLLDNVFIPILCELGTTGTEQENVLKEFMKHGACNGSLMETARGCLDLHYLVSEVVPKVLPRMIVSSFIPAKLSDQLRTTIEKAKGTNESWAELWSTSYLVSDNHGNECSFTHTDMINAISTPYKLLQIEQQAVIPIESAQRRRSACCNPDSLPCVQKLIESVALKLQTTLTNKINSSDVSLPAQPTSQSTGSPTKQSSESDDNEEEEVEYLLYWDSDCAEYIAPLVCLVEAILPDKRVQQAASAEPTNLPAKIANAYKNIESHSFLLTAEVFRAIIAAYCAAENLRSQDLTKFTVNFGKKILLSTLIAYFYVTYSRISLIIIVTM